LKGIGRAGLISVRTLLEANPLSASAPCRIDAGGTFDIRAFALTHRTIYPTTVNIALSLRTTVRLLPFDDGWIKISSAGFEKEETHRIEDVPFDSPMGIMFAAVSYFGFHGLRMIIDTQVPTQASLGGSSTALVAAVKALSKLKKAVGEKALSRKGILHLAFQIEDSVAGGFCGAQDHAAAVYGGVNQWIWRFGEPGGLAERRTLLDRSGQRELGRHILTAYSGIKHVSGSINRGWVTDFLKGKKRESWMEINAVVHELARALREGLWHEAGAALAKEMLLRRRVTPGALIPFTERLIDEAAAAGCGARFAGAGAGGCVWALGDTRSIESLRPVWETSLKTQKGAMILDCSVDPSGVT